MSTLLRYPIALVVSFVAAFALTPFVARLAAHTGVVAHPRPDRAHAITTPSLGGLAVAAGIATVAIPAVYVQPRLGYALVAALMLCGVGTIDDARTVRPVVKLVVESGGAVALWIAGIRAEPFDNVAIDLAITILWVLAVTNAINLLDNLDGLSSGIVAIAATTCFVIAVRQGRYVEGSIALGITGASLGFLSHNFPPARIFLGDAGTLMLGFLLAALGLRLDLAGPGRSAAHAVTPVLIVGVPLFDVTLVTIARLRGRRPVYRGGTDHASHRLINAGVSPDMVAILTFDAQLVSSGLALWLVKQPPARAVEVGAACAAVGVSLLVWFLRLPENVEVPQSTRAGTGVSG